jgi:diacylglycerol kinase family enzyme
MRRRILIVHNAYAGMRHQRLLREACRNLADAGAQVQIMHAGTIEQDREVARAAAADGGFDAVVAAGGDSTIRGVASGLIGSTMPLGIIPIGTGNVLAEEIGLRRDPGTLTEVLLRGPSIDIRYGLADTTPFLIMMGAGFDARVVGRLSTPWKRSIGKLAYAWPIVREIFRKPKSFEVVIDGRPVRATWLVVTRVAHYGGSFVIAERQTLTEDGFHAVMATAESRWAFAGVLIAIALERHALRPDVAVIPCKHISIAETRSLATQLDGEPVAPCPREFTLSEDRLKLIVPQGSPLVESGQSWSARQHQAGIDETAMKR